MPPLTVSISVQRGQSRPDPGCRNTRHDTLSRAALDLRFNNCDLYFALHGEAEVIPPVSYKHSPLDLIRARSSVRRFDGRILSPSVRRELERTFQALPRGPLGNRCRFQLVDTNHGEDDRGALGDSVERVGAYGTIRGARTYLAGAAPAADYSLEDFGYLFELILLKATDLNLGSCWLGGIFSRDRFARAIALRPGELLPAVSPIGVPTVRRGMVDRMIRWGAGSARRKAWEELFYDADRDRPLSREEAAPLATALEMLRLAPSASNRQPWRCIRDRQSVHLYLLRTPGYRALTREDLQRVDMGIAMAHFDLAMSTAGREGRWHFSGTLPVCGIPDAWQKARYLVSWSETGQSSDL